jgi:hypothetical protein
MQAHKLLTTNTSDPIEVVPHMKFQKSRGSGHLRSWLLLASATLLSGASGQGAESVELNAEFNEPIFGLYYDTRAVHFDLLPTKDLMPDCKTALVEYHPLPPALTLYAEYISPTTRIYIAGAQDILGIYVVRAGHCDSGVPILSLLQRHHNPPKPTDAPTLSDAEVSALFSDALLRYTKALGGKKSFLQWLDALSEHARIGCKGQPEFSCPPTYHTLQPALQQMLDNYRRE